MRRQAPCPRMVGPGERQHGRTLSPFNIGGTSGTGGTALILLVFSGPNGIWRGGTSGTTLRLPVPVVPVAIFGVGPENCNETSVVPLVPLVPAIFD